jgi:hypothetical protein
MFAQYKLDIVSLTLTLSLKIKMSNLYPVTINNPSSAVTLTSITAQDITTWYAIQFTYTGNSGNISGNLLLPGLDANNNVNWQVNYAFTGSSPLSSMITFDNATTVLRFPVSGIYTIHWRVRTAQSSQTLQGNSVGPYLMPLTYLGVVNTKTTGNNSGDSKLCGEDTYTGANTNGNSLTDGDTTVSFTGFFMANDAVALGVYSGYFYQNSVCNPSSGTRITCSLMIPAY